MIYVECGLLLIVAVLMLIDLWSMRQASKSRKEFVDALIKNAMAQNQCSQCVNYRKLNTMTHEYIPRELGTGSPSNKHQFNMENYK